MLNVKFVFVDFSLFTLKSSGSVETFVPTPRRKKTTFCYYGQFKVKMTTYSKKIKLVVKTTKRSIVFSDFFLVLINLFS